MFREKGVREDGIDGFVQRRPPAFAGDHPEGLNGHDLIRGIEEADSRGLRDVAVHGVADEAPGRLEPPIETLGFAQVHEEGLVLRPVPEGDVLDPDPEGHLRREELPDLDVALLDFDRAVGRTGAERLVDPFLEAAILQLDHAGDEVLDLDVRAQADATGPEVFRARSGGRDGVEKDARLVDFGAPIEVVQVEVSRHLEPDGAAAIGPGRHRRILRRSGLRQCQHQRGDRQHPVTLEESPGVRQKKHRVYFVAGYGG